MAQFVGQQVAFGERFEDGLAALVDFGELDEAVPDAGDGDLVEAAGGLLPIACDERDGPALGDEPGGGGDLLGRDPEFGGNAGDVLFVHQSGPRLYRVAPKDAMRFRIETPGGSGRTMGAP